MNKNKINTVGIITNFRAASTSFSLLKAEEYNLPWKGEMFCHSVPHGLGDVLSTTEIFQKMAAGEEVAKYTEDERDILFLNEIKKGTPCCFKVMPSHIGNKQTLREVARSVDKLFYLYKRDFVSQVKSYLSLALLGNFLDTGFQRRHSVFTFEGMKDVHLGTSGDSEKVISKVTAHEQSKFPFHTATSVRQGLIENYKEMAQLYKEIPGELVCSDDYFSGERYKPYNKEIVWEIGEPEVEDFDVEGLFK
jgi:hypothetical protein